MSNNAAERELRAVAVGRRNWTFAGSDHGGRRAAAIYTLILDEKSPLVAVFFGYPNADDSSHAKLRDLLANSVTVIPCVGLGTDVSSQLPESIRHINAYQSSYQEADWARIIQVFLSASVPLPDRDRRFAETADVIAIREAIKAVVGEVIPRGCLVFGGHPAITPLVARLVRAMGPEV